MSVLNETYRVQYTITSTTQTLSVPFYFLENSHLRVLKGDTDLLLTTNYTVTGAGNENGGSITLTGTGVAINDVITIKRDVPFDQQVDLSQTDRLPSATLERMADKNTMLAQQLNEIATRSFRVAESENLTEAQLTLTVAERAGKVLGFDSTGLPTPMLPVSAVFASGDQIFVSNVVALAGVSVSGFTTGMKAYLGGFYDDGDGGDGWFRYDSASTATAVAGMVIVPTVGSGCWIRIWDSVLSVKWTGAKGDGTTNDTAAIVAANNYLRTGASSFRDRRGTLFFPRGMYLITPGLLYFDVSLVSYKGDGATLKTTGAAGVAVYLTGSIGNSGQPYNNVLQSVEGISLWSGLATGGGSPTSGTIGYSCGSTGSYTVGPAHVPIRNGNIDGFEKGIVYGDDCYMLKWYSVDVFNCTYGIDEPASLPNSGECHEYHSCTFYGCGVPLRLYNTNSDHVFFGGSLDYSTWIYDIKGANVSFLGTHIEWSSASDNPFVVENGSRVLHIGCFFIYSNTSGSRMANCWAIYGNATVRISNSFLHQLNPTTGRLAQSADNTGRLHLDNTTSYSVTDAPVRTLIDENMVNDGGFETGFGCFGGIDAGNTIASLRSAANLVVTRDTAEKRTGTYSIKLAKSSGAGSNASYTFLVPIKQGCRYSGRVYTKSDAAAGTNWLVARGFCSAAEIGGVLEIYNKRELGSTTYAIPTSGWQEFTIQAFPVDQVPRGGETYLYVQVNLFGVYIANVWVDDLEIYQY